MAVDLLAREVVIVPCGEVVAVQPGCECAGQREDLQAVPRQFEITDDLGPQQAHHVAELGEAVAGEDLLGHRCAAQHLAALQHHHFFARAGKVGCGHEAVVAAADHDRVIAIH